MRKTPALAVLLLAVAPGIRAEAPPPVRARHAMVVTREAHATDAGVAVLKAGGNAVDAAVAAGFALAVTHPSAGNIGGGGFMLVRLRDGRSAFIDFRERAPRAATRDMYLGPDGRPTKDSTIGWRAAGVPGTVRGLEFAHKKYGRRPWASLVAPAISLAAGGFPVSPGLARSLNGGKELANFAETRRIFRRNGARWNAGETLAQPELARTLKRIADHGARDFYEDETARTLAQAMAANGGLITLEDLRQYAVVERKPLEGKYRGCDILTAPPPSSGGLGILQMLGVLDGSRYQQSGPDTAPAIHFVAEAMRRFFAERSVYLADPDYVKVPVAGLLAKEHLVRLRESIDPRRATPSDSLHPGEPLFEPSDTTHYSIIDAEGNAVAVTYTLNGGYGSGVTVPGLGFLLNNEMDDFSAKPGSPNDAGLVQGEANAIQPGKRPLSSMTPTILLRENRPFLVLGSPGSGRIISTVLQVILNVVDHGMNVRDAVARPRFHHQWQPDELLMEPGFPRKTVHELQRRGHQVKTASGIGEAEAILARDGWLEGAADPRVEGKAGGY